MKVQKAKLIETSRYFCYLRYYSKTFYDYVENQTYISKDKLESIKKILQNTLVVMQQYTIIMNSCSDTSNFADELIEVPVLSIHEDLIDKSDLDSNKITAIINSVIQLTEKIHIAIEKSNSCIPAAEKHIKEPNFIAINDFDNICNDIDSLVLKLKELVDKFGNIPLSYSAKWILQELNNINLAKTDVNETKEIEIAEFRKSVENVVVKIFFVIQNVFAKYKEKKCDSAEDEKDVNNLQENHLKNLIVEELLDDVAKLEMKQIYLKIVKIANVVFNVDPLKNSACRSLVSNLLPVLDQIILLYQYFITQQVSIYRVTCKMCSILTNIFLDLATKVSIYAKLLYSF